MEKIDNLSMIWKIMQALQDTGSMDEALQGSLAELAQYVGVSTASIWLLNTDEQRIYAVSGYGKDAPVGYSIDNGNGIVGEVTKGGEYVIIADTKADERFPGGNDEITGLETENMLCYPLRLPGKSIGCLQLVNKNGEYNDDDLAICKTFCGLAAMVIDEAGYSFSQATEKKVILSVRNVIKEYESGSDKLRVLKGIDLDIYENEFIVILGESGCGKSTMLNIIGGMDSMTEGEMYIDGKDFSHPTDMELTNYRRNDIGFIFQSYNLMPNLTALENVQFIAENTANPGDSREAIEMVGLGERANNYPSTMSGGQQQRVSIARAIVKNPRLILADEPTAALDFTTGQEVLRVIEMLVSKKITTVIMVTHNVEIAKMANRVIRFKDGKISSIRINAWPLKADDLVW